MRTVCQEAIDLIKLFEGLRLRAYRCPAGIWTIGYGHTKDVYEGMIITQATADRFLNEDLQEAIKAATSYVKVSLNDNQFGALVSFIFNMGVGNFSGSTLLKRLNAGRYEDVPAQLMRWKYSRGELLKGLVGRRAAEADLWNRKVL